MAQGTTTAKSSTVTAESGRHATWLELFFDLVFVLAIAQLARYLHDNPTPGGFFGFLFLFVAVWWAWVGFTIHADLFDADDEVLYRLAMLLAALLSISLAVNVPEALAGASAGFAASYALLRFLLVGMYARAWWRMPRARSLVARYAGGFFVGALLWAASIFVPEPARYALWALGLLVELATPIFAQLTALLDRPVQVSHQPERFGLFTIIVLGESITLVGLGVAGTEWRLSSVLVAVSGFVCVACLWWIYFSRVDETVVERSYAGGARERLLGFAWGYGHLPIYAGLTMFAVGIEFAIVAVLEGTLDTAARALLCGGIAIYLVAKSAIHPLSPNSLPLRIIAVRLAVAALLLALIPAGVFLSPAVFAGLVALLVVGLTVFDSADTGRLGSTGKEAA